MWSLLVLLFGTLNLTSAQSSILGSNPLIPAGTSIAGNYNGPLRPQVHFSAPQGFINDPNGMFLDSNGTYHLYYQYNPTQTIAGYQHWGHATSQDLYHWENQPIALAPSNISEGIFSGSAVTDPNNTSGFFPNQTNGVVAFYTLNGPDVQTQNLAYSYDGGYSFTKYSGNPLIDIGSNQFRDPKVLWYEDHWIMAVSFVREFTIGLYTSTDMRNWTLASNFTPHGLTGLQWECPNLVEMPVEDSDESLWLFYISVQPGAPQGGSISQYFPGTFNGTHFMPVDPVARIGDWGKDNYAGQFFSGIPANERQISIVWASNWEYCNYVPTGPLEGWQSTMSLPRANTLRNTPDLGWQLVSLPYELEAVQQQTAVAQNASLGNGTLLADLSGGTGAFVINVNVTGLNFSGLSNTASVNFTVLSSVSGESIQGGQFAGSQGAFYLDRGNVRGFNNVFFTDRFSTATDIDDHFDFQVVFDRSIVEVFAFNGQSSATSVYYPEYPLDTVLVGASGLNSDATVNVSVYELNSAWASAENSTGYVQPNGTTIVKRNMLGANLWAM